MFTIHLKTNWTQIYQFINWLNIYENISVERNYVNTTFLDIQHLFIKVSNTDKNLKLNLRILIKLFFEVSN